MAERIARRSPEAYLDALLQHREGVMDGRAGAADALRRLAAQLAVVARVQGLIDVARAATRVGASADKQLSKTVDVLLSEVRRSGRRGGQGPVLVVDDDATLRSIVQMIVKPYASDVVAVSTLAAARRVVLERPPSAVVVDLGLPDGDGRELVSELGSDLALQDVPILVLSANDDPAVRAECLALGAREVHLKPLDALLTTNALSGWLGFEDRSSLMLLGDVVTGLFDEGMMAESVSQCATRWVESGQAWSLLSVRVKDKKPTSLRAVADDLRQAFSDSQASLGFVDDTFYAVLPRSDRAAAAVVAARLQVLLSKRGPVGVGGAEMSDASWGIAWRTARRMADLARSAGEAVVVEGGGDRTRKQVLLVDDDPVVASLLEGLLARDRLRVAHLPDGTRLARSLERLRPAALILDLDLPHSDGLELLGQVRAHRQFRKLPVLAISAHRESRYEVAAFNAGADDFLGKPLVPDVLRARLARMMGT